MTLWLIGTMGSGETTVGRIATDPVVAFLDTAVRQFAGEGAVISTGGGVVLESALSVEEVAMRIEGLWPS